MLFCVKIVILSSQLRMPIYAEKIRVNNARGADK